MLVFFPALRPLLICESLLLQGTIIQISREGAMPSSWVFFPCGLEGTKESGSKGKTKRNV